MVAMAAVVAASRANPRGLPFEGSMLCDSSSAGEGIGQCEDVEFPDIPVCTTPIRSIIRLHTSSSGSRSAWLPLLLSKDGASYLYMHSPKMEKEKGVGGGSDTGQTLKGGCSGRCHRRCDNQATLGSHRPVSVHAAVPHEKFGEGGDEKETRKVTRDPARYAICSCNALAPPPPFPSLGKGGGGWGVGGRTVLSGNMPTGYRQSKATSKGSTEGISCKAARTGQNKATELLFCTFDHPWFWFWSVGRSLACAMWCVYWPMLNVLMCYCATLERGEVGRYVQVCDSRGCLVIPLAYLPALSTPTHPETQRRECGGVVVQSLAQPERSGEYIPMLLAWFVCQRETSGKPI